jgi:deoxyribose-phosphate aldolase
MNAAEMASYVDHTLLHADATHGDIDRLCTEARHHHFAAVCVNGMWVGRCVSRLQGSDVKIAAVVGFPLGATMPMVKALEASRLVEAGADELDMVAPIGAIKDGAWDYVEDDITAVMEAASGRPVKVILETAALQREEIIKGTVVAREAGAQFVKTSTGFHPAGGATVDAVRLLRSVVGEAMGVKASGGIRDRVGAQQMIDAGANRIGTSSGVAIVETS